MLNPELFFEHMDKKIQSDFSVPSCIKIYSSIKESGKIFLHYSYSNDEKENIFIGADIPDFLKKITGWRQNGLTTIEIPDIKIEISLKNGPAAVVDKISFAADGNFTIEGSENYISFMKDFYFHRNYESYESKVYESIVNDSFYFVNLREYYEKNRKEFFFKIIKETAEEEKDFYNKLYSNWLFENHLNDSVQNEKRFKKEYKEYIEKFLTKWGYDKLSDYETDKILVAKIFSQDGILQTALKKQYKKDSENFEKNFIKTINEKTSVEKFLTFLREEFKIFTAYELPVFKKDLRGNGGKAIDFLFESILRGSSSDVIPGRSKIEQYETERYVLAQYIVFFAGFFDYKENCAETFLSVTELLEKKFKEKGYKNISETFKLTNIIDSGMDSIRRYFLSYFPEHYIKYGLFASLVKEIINNSNIPRQKALTGLILYNNLIQKTANESDYLLKLKAFANVKEFMPVSSTEIFYNLSRLSGEDLKKALFEYGYIYPMVKHGFFNNKSKFCSYLYEKGVDTETLKTEIYLMFGVTNAEGLFKSKKFKENYTKYVKKNFLEPYAEINVKQFVKAYGILENENVMLSDTENNFKENFFLTKVGLNKEHLFNDMVIEYSKAVYSKNALENFCKTDVKKTKNPEKTI